MRILASFLIILAYLAFPSFGRAEVLDAFKDPVPPPPTLPSNAELARKVQNPISNLTSALLENNFNSGFGTTQGLQYVANLEEFYPVKLSDGLNLVQRFILPFISQPETIPGQGGHGGLGDIQYQAYLTSVNSTGFVFGLGPIVSAPTAYPHELGNGKWSLGPALAAVIVQKDWVGGVIGNELVSISNYNDRPNVNQMQLQPFLNFYFSNAWYISSSPVITANWQAPNNNRWDVPVGGGIGNVFRISRAPIKTEVQAFDHVISPQQGPNWSARLQIQFLFPSEKESKASVTTY